MVKLTHSSLCWQCRGFDRFGIFVLDFEDWIRFFALLSLDRSLLPIYHLAGFSSRRSARRELRRGAIPEFHPSHSHVISLLPSLASAVFPTLFDMVKTTISHSPMTDGRGNFVGCKSRFFKLVCPILRSFTLLHSQGQKSILIFTTLK